MGGVHPQENKLSRAKAIEVLPLPEVVQIPLGQHIGAPATAKVAKGDKVLTGQLIAEATGFMSANHDLQSNLSEFRPEQHSQASHLAQDDRTH